MDKDFHFLLYQSADEEVSVNTVIKNETIWLAQKAMAELFDCSSDNISLHLKNIFSEGELSKSATAEEISVVQQEGSSGCHYFRRLSREFTQSNKFSHLGDRCFKGIYD